MPYIARAMPLSREGNRMSGSGEVWEGEGRGGYLPVSAHESVTLLKNDNACPPGDE